MILEFWIRRNEAMRKIWFNFFIYFYEYQKENVIEDRSNLAWFQTYAVSYYEIKYRNKVWNQPFFDNLHNFLFILATIFRVHLCRLRICWRIWIWFVQQRLNRRLNIGNLPTVRNNISYITHDLYNLSQIIWLVWTDEVRSTNLPI